MFGTPDPSPRIKAVQSFIGGKEVTGKPSMSHNRIINSAASMVNFFAIVLSIPTRYRILTAVTYLGERFSQK